MDKGACEMSNIYAIYHPTGDHRFRTTPTAKTTWVAGALAVLYVFGVVQYLSPAKFIGLGVPTATGLLAGVFGLFAVTIAHDRSWMAWLGIATAIVGLVVALLVV